MRDSFGNIAHGHGSARSYVDTGLTLHPGEVVTFECHAWDPEGVGYSWHVIMDVARSREPDFAGDSYVWPVQVQDIAEARSLTFYMASERAYHRRSQYDDAVSLTYRVLPTG